MIHFFRKIRHDLISNSKTFRYLKYATGEIILVVLGILIALYINNWNELRKEQDKFNLTLVDVEKEIIDNISWTNGIILNLIIQDSVSLEFFIDSVKFENYELYSVILQPWGRHQFRNETLEKVSQFNDLTEVQRTIMNELIDLDRVWRQRHFDDYANRYIEIANKRSETFMKYDWYNSWLSGLGLSQNESYLDFVVNDPYYLKTALLTRQFNQGYRSNLGIYKQNALPVYDRIYNYLDSLGLKHSDSLLFQYDLKDYKHYLGKYDAIWCSEKNYVFDDSCIVSSENGKLYWNAYRNDDAGSKKEITPINRYHFIDENQGLYHLQFDDRGEVEGIRFSSQINWFYSLKKNR